MKEKILQKHEIVPASFCLYEQDVHGVSFLQDVFPQLSFDYLKGILEFSSGSLKIIHQSKKMLPFVCFFLSFSGFSVMMQADNLLEAIPYSFKKYFLSRLYHGILSFILCLLFLQFGLI